MPIQAYVMFNGECRQAVEYYAEVFETAAPEIMTYNDAPPDPDFQMPDEAKDLVMNTSLLIDGSTVMFGDNVPGMMPAAHGNNISLTIVTKDKDYITRVFDRLRESGKVQMDLQETFWTSLYGKVTDKFGIEWQFSYDEEPQY